jgi:hypothetical protein
MLNNLINYSAMCIPSYQLIYLLKDDNTLKYGGEFYILAPLGKMQIAPPPQQQDS